MTTTPIRHSTGPPPEADDGPLIPVESRRLTSAGRGVAIVVLSLLMAAFLDADSLASSVSQQPFGASRSFELAPVNVIKTISHWTGLNQPVRLINHQVHRRPVTAGHAVKLQPAPRPGAKAGVDGGSPAVAGPVQGPPARRVPTVQQPLKVWMAGDSLMGSISQSFTALVRADARLQVSSDYRIGTGLARPDVFNWPDRIRDQLVAATPDVVVLSFGTNDDQDMASAGRRVALGGADWQATYARRVNDILTIAATGTRQVIWLGIPAVRRARLNHTKDIINQVVKTAAASFPAVAYVDPGPALDTPAGGYTTYLNDNTGKPIAVRESDGIHLTMSGANHVTPLILTAIEALWSVPPPRP
jgi:hypothetical protein